ncbi:hypothetical protein B4U80_06368 [Leptotrombidium deliense]|uniref:Uncharacterized protein n=1 Tax=Leptotrombidium deliense TaxID=299467 RepID=A0A443SW98_9ACAR|nr:hypothetical protein B4U80_06368 [Leptotrombidium deliense]
MSRQIWECESWKVLVFSI